MAMIFAQGNTKIITSKIDFCPTQKLIELDADTSKFLDAIVDLTAKICIAPVSLLSIVSDETVWLQSQVGENFAQIKQNRGKFCGIFPKENDFYEVSDTDKDDIHKAHGFLIKGAITRFYAGARIQLPNEENVFGVLSVFDICPRTLIHLQRDYLRGMANLIGEYLRTKKLLSKLN